MLMNIDRINEQEKKWLLEEKYDGVASVTYEQECALIDKGMPVAYLIGNIEFLGCHIDLLSKPLIPRAETEYWVGEVIRELKKKHSSEELQKLKILDIFSGSGCIGIALAKHLESHIDFAELKSEHVEQIHKNLSLNCDIEYINEKTKVFESDIFNNVPQSQYDYIFANPPYVPKDRVHEVQSSVIQHEDLKAVFADDHGNGLIKELVSNVNEYIHQGSIIYIEHDPSQTDYLKTYLENNFSISAIADQYTKTRVLTIRTKRSSQSPLTFEHA